MSLETELAANTAALIALTEVLKSAASGATVEKKPRVKKTEDAPAATEGAANPAAEVKTPEPAKVVTPTVVTPTVVIPTQQDVRAAATALLDADMKANGGSDANAKKTFEAIKAEYKVSKVSDVPEAQRASAIATLHAALVNLAKSSGADAI